MLERAVIATIAGKPTTILRISWRRSPQAEFSENSAGRAGTRLVESSLEDIVVALFKRLADCLAQHLGALERAFIRVEHLHGALSIYFTGIS